MPVYPAVVVAGECPGTDGEDDELGQEEGALVPEGAGYCVHADRTTRGGGAEGGGGDHVLVVEKTPAAGVNERRKGWCEEHSEEVNVIPWDTQRFR